MKRPLVNDPKSVIEGRDPELECAVVEVMRRLDKPRRFSPRLPAPVKTK